MRYPKEFVVLRKAGWLLLMVDGSMQLGVGVGVGFWKSRENGDVTHCVEMYAQRIMEQELTGKLTR